MLVALWSQSLIQEEQTFMLIGDEHKNLQGTNDSNTSQYDVKNDSPVTKAQFGYDYPKEKASPERCRRLEGEQKILCEVNLSQK